MPTAAASSRADPRSAAGPSRDVLARDALACGLGLAEGTEPEDAAGVDARGNPPVAGALAREPLETLARRDDNRPSPRSSGSVAPPGLLLPQIEEPPEGLGVLPVQRPDGALLEPVERGRRGDSHLYPVDSPASRPRTEPTPPAPGRSPGSSAARPPSGRGSRLEVPVHDPLLVRRREPPRPVHRRASRSRSASRRGAGRARAGLRPGSGRP